MIPFIKLRDLLLETPLDDGRGAYVSAASGLVCLKERFYVVADDELSLCSFTYSHSDPGHSLLLFDGRLPLDPKARKKAKPDLEALVILPASQDLPDSSLLALPSGSKSNRSRGSFMAFGKAGKVTGCPQTIDCAALYEQLSETFSDLNIEGAVVRNDQLILLQRGNGSSPNALIELSLKQVLESLKHCRITAHAIERVIYFELGTLNGVKLSFTDLIMTPNQELLYTAVAEATESTYDDGHCSGTVVGLIDANGNLGRQLPISPRMKAEGIGLMHDESSGKTKVYLVTDGDDATLPAGLYCQELGQVLSALS